MQLFRNILGAIRSAWSNRFKAVKTPRRHILSGVDHLDHRQLLTASFTGNVINDFPAATGPGVKFLVNGPSVQPNIPVSLSSLISVTGFNQSGVALSYDPVSDQLAVGLLQPNDGRTVGQVVIAGDADNNLNSATVDPAVLAVMPTFSDLADLGGSEEMGVFFDLNNDGVPDIIAGVAGDPAATKNFQVAEAVPQPNPMSPPRFGAQFPSQYAGNFYLVNDPAHPSMEFTINHFSTLFQQVTGTPLTSSQVLTAGAVGKASSDSGISEAVYFAQPFTWQGVNPATDLAITKTAIPSPVRVNNTLVYSIVVKNNGPFADNAVNVTDAFPAGVNLVSVTPSQGTNSTTPTGFSSSLGPIAAGGSASILVVAQPTAVGTITNTATVTGSILDTDPSNNTATLNTPVLAPLGPVACPPILVNPHHTGIVNTIHRTLIRVNVFGTADFDVNSINSSTVRLSGAVPIGEFTQRINGDHFMDRTYLFAGNDPALATLPAGFTTMTLTGATATGGQIASQANVFNVDQGVFTPEVARRYQNEVGTAAKLAREQNPRLHLIDVLYPAAAAAATRSHAAPGSIAGAQLGSSTVRIPGVGVHQPPVVHHAAAPKVHLGASSVRIPITNGFGSPVVINNPGGTRAASAGVNLNPRKTVKVTPAAHAPGTRIRANVATNINDFAMSS